MKAILLCAGFATRLRPLTDDYPKPLLDVGGRPLLDDLLDRLVEGGGMRDLVLVSNGRFARQFEAYAARAELRLDGVRVRVVDDGAMTNETRLGAVRDLQLALAAERLDGPVFVAAADNLVRFDLRAFADDFRAHPRNLILSYVEPDLAARRRSGVAVVDNDGRVVQFVEKAADPPGELCCPPFYFLMADALAEIPRLLAAHPDIDAPGGLIAWLVDRVRVDHHAMRGRRFDIGDLESYRAAQAFVAAERDGNA